MSDETTAFRAFQLDPNPGTLIDLLRTHQERVFRLCFHVLRREHDAEDAAQEVLLRITGEVRRFSDADSFRRWLYRVCLNAALESARKSARRRVHETRAAMEKPAPASLDPAVRLAVFEGLAALEDGERDLLMERYFEGESLESIGARAGCSAPAIHKRLEDTRESLRRRLGVVLPALPDLTTLFPPAPAAPDLVAGAVLAKATSTAALAAAGGMLMASKTSMVAAVVITAVLCLAAGTGLGIALKGRSERERTSRRDGPVPGTAGTHRETPSQQATPAPAPDTATAEAPKLSPLASRLARFKAWKGGRKAEFEKLRGTLAGGDLSTYLSNQRREQVKELEGMWELANAEPATFLAFLQAPENEALIEGFIYGALGFSRLEPGFIMIRSASFKDFSAELTQGMFELAKAGTSAQRAEALAFFGRLTEVPAEQADYFRDLIYDSDPRVQTAAIGVLTGTRTLSGDNLKALIALGEKSTDGAVQRRVADALRYVDQPEAGEYLFARLENPRDAKEFVSVVTALGHKVMISTKTGGTPVSEERFLNAVSAQWNLGHDENAFRAIVHTVLSCPGDLVRQTLVGALTSAPTASTKEMVALIVRRLEEGEKDRESLKAMIYNRK